MSTYIWDGGSYDFPTQRDLDEDAYWDAFVAAERESADEHYEPELEGSVAVCDLCGDGNPHDHDPEEYGYPSGADEEALEGHYNPEGGDTDWDFYFPEREPEPVQIALFVYVDGIVYVLGVAYG